MCVVLYLKLVSHRVRRHALRRNSAQLALARSLLRLPLLPSAFSHLLLQLYPVARALYIAHVGLSRYAKTQTA